MTHPFVDQILVPAIVWFFLVFGIVGFAVGIGLVLNHERMHRFFEVMNQWVSMRRSTKWLAVPRYSGLPLQQYRHVAGTTIILAAVVSTGLLSTRGYAQGAISSVPFSMMSWVLESLRWFLICGGVFAVVVGVMLMFFPGAFRALELRANSWYSFRNHSLGVDSMHMGLDRWVERYPRSLGLVIAVGALIVTVNYGILVIAGG